MPIRSVFRSFSVVFTSLVALVLITLLLKQSPTQAHSLYRATAVNCVGSIQACIDAAADGDTIVIPAGTYTESLTLSKAVSLTGENRDTTIIHAVAGQRVLTVTGATITHSVVISGLTLADGLADRGGGILLDNQAQPVIHNLILYNNRADKGGGLYSDGPLSLVDTRVISNSAIHGGGGAYIGMTATLTSGEFIANDSWDDGGGAYLLQAATITGTQFRNNHGANGGGLFADLYTSQSRWVLTNTEFFGNAAQAGGGAAVGGTIQINGGRFENNTANTFGGGLFGDRAMLSGTEFISNSAVSYGGGVFAYDANVSDALFERNSSSAGDGGGLCAHQILLGNTTFISNTALRGGGVVLGSVGTGRSRIVNSLLAGNIATDNGTAIYIDAPGQYDFIHTTIAGSTSVTQPAIAVLTGTLYLTNTIIASHTIAISNTGGTVFEDYNLFSGNLTNTIGVTSGGHSLVGDPKFVDPLNGDYHLQLGSAAIDHGVDAGVYIDLDGNLRPHGAGFDIGAYEFQGSHYLWLPLIRK